MAETSPIDSTAGSSGTILQAETGGATARTSGRKPTRTMLGLVYNLSPYGADVEKVANAMLAALLLGLIIAGFGGGKNGWLMALLWGGACSAVGWALGFLFGIPRTLSGQPDQGAGQAVVGVQEPGDSGAPAKATASISRQASSANTNLEQVSDWLTKILVGVSLVEFQKVGTALGSAAVVMADSLGGGSYWKSFSIALMTYFATTGFLGSYLLTRLFLQKLFSGENN